ncbi:MAG: 4-(cytidine 5'-diphospho)-2-C-methyl-D-erythritol kinase [Brevinemataceae bacterium]
MNKDSYYFQSSSKINLYLDITGKDPIDGYHYIKSIFTEINWGDNLIITPAKEDSVIFENNPEIDSRKNTVFKALTLFKEKYHIKDCWNISIHKNVPLGAGLGGGSGDAGALLKWLSKWYHINKEDTLDIAFETGSDVPFFIYGGTALVEGKGEKITPLASKLKNMGILIIYPKIHINTKKAFQTISPLIKSNGTKELKSTQLDKIIRKKIDLSLDILDNLAYNIFDSNLQNLDRDIFFYKRYLIENLNPQLIFMTGSGSSLVLIFNSKHQLENAKFRSKAEIIWTRYFD